MKMLEQKRNPHHSRIRLFFALMLAMAAVLLIGAGRLGDSMVSRQTEQDDAHRQWQNAASQVLRRGSAERQQYHELQKLAVEHPEYLLQAIHTGMRPETDR